MNVIPFTQGNCSIPIQLKLYGEEAITLMCLDTGADVNVAGKQRLENLFHTVNEHIYTTKEQVQLITANKSHLNVIGRIDISCFVNKNCSSLSFYVVDHSNIMLIGAKGLGQLGIVLDMSANLCFTRRKTESNTIGKIINLIHEQSLYINTPVVQQNNTRKCLWLTPHISQEIAGNKYNSLILRVINCTPTELNKLIYERINIYDCLCNFSAEGQCTECEKECMSSGILKPVSIMWPGNANHVQLMVEVIYRNSWGQILQPKTDRFCGVVETGQHKVCAISAVKDDFACAPFSYTWDGANWDFETGGFVVDDIIQPDEKLNTKESFKTFQEVFPKQCCDNCLAAGRVFCSLADSSCTKLMEVRNKHEQIKQTANKMRCEIRPWEDSFRKNNFVIPLFKSSRIKEWLMDTYPRWGEILSVKSFRNCEMIIEKIEGAYHYLIGGTEPTLLELQEFFKQIGEQGVRLKLTQIMILDFYSFRCSLHLLKTAFSKNQIQLSILTDISPFLVVTKSVRKVGFGENVASSVLEDLDMSKINILTNNEGYIKRFQDLAKELNKCEGELTSLWSSSTHDIGLMHSGPPHFRVLEFNFPIDPGKRIAPISNKSSFLSPQLIEPATKMVEALCEAGVIRRGFSIFNAVTHFIPKSKQELSLQQWVERGNPAETFVSGCADERAPQLLRMVTHFRELNEICTNNCIVQQSTSEQLKHISARVKFCSIIDITGMFHSLKLSEKAVEFTGFQTTIPGYGNCVYLRMPMGAKFSKCAQDAALLYALNDIPDLILYADNCLIFSECPETHICSVEKTLQKLRQHGLKCKLSKLTLMASKIVKLYGFYIDLENNRILPAEDKISALRNREIPKSRKQLKRFLGSINFFSSLLPICGEYLSILYKATRGAKFMFGEEEKMAFESIIELLHNDSLLYVHRADPGLQYKLVVDSSESHTGWILYQECPNSHPKVLSYNNKTWNLSFSKEIPAMRELLGIITALKAVQLDVQYSEKGLLLYTDSIPIVLANIYAKHSAKISRYKIFLESLHWLEIQFTPGKSSLMSLADFFSRKNSDSKKFSQKKPQTCDQDTCVEYNKKLKTGCIYPAATSMFVIDSLLETPVSELADIKDDSFLALNKSNYEYFSLKDKQNKTFQLKVKELDTEVGDVRDSIDADVQVITRQNKKVATKFCGSGKGKNSQIVSLKQQEPMEYISDLTSMKEEDADIKRNNIIYDTDQVKDPTLKSLVRLKFVKDSGSLEILDKEANVKTQGLPLTKSQHKENVNIEVCLSTKNGEVDADKFRKYYNDLTGIATYLNFEELRKAQVFDPFWYQILKNVRTYSQYQIGNKIYFLNNGVLYCKELYKGLELFKLIIPDIVAHNLVIQSHRMTNCSKGMKLFNSISISFEIRALKEIISRVVAQCFACNQTAVKPFSSTRQDLPKHPTLLQQKAECWSIDELYIRSETSTPEGSFFKLLVAIDLFTHFVVARPIFGTLTEKKVLEFINENIIQIFTKPRIICTDNASNMNSELIKACCAYYDIYKATISPYMSKGLLAELANRLIIDGLRASSTANYVSPAQAHLLITPVITMINTLPFKNEKVLCPFSLMFGILPKVDILQFYEGEIGFSDNVSDRHSYFQQLARVNDCLSKIRLGQIENRTYSSNKKQTDDYYNKIQVGSLVALRNPEVINKSLNHKLKPRFRNRFYVVRREDSAVFLSPCKEISLEDFQANRDNINLDSYSAGVYKTDITSLKLINNLLIINSNKKDLFYKNFLSQNSLPENFYYNKNETGNALVRTLCDMQEKCEKEIFDENVNIVQVLAVKQLFLPKKNMKGILKKTKIFSAKVSEVMKTFHKIQGRVKTVTFSPFVKMYKMITPSLLYYCLHPKFIDLCDTPKQSSLLRNIGNNKWCACKLCRIGNSVCVTNSCEWCSIKVPGANRTNGDEDTIEISEH